MGSELRFLSGAPDGIRTRAAGLKDEQELPSDLRFFAGNTI
jgi:hypothetical protein